MDLLTHLINLVQLLNHVHRFTNPKNESGIVSHRPFVIDRQKLVRAISKQTGYNLLVGADTASRRPNPKP